MPVDDAPYRSRLWKPLRARILARDGNICTIKAPGCTTTATDVDHIWSWRLGKQYWFDEANLRSACSRCNRGRRGELVIADASVLPQGVAASATELIIADIASGRTWLLDPTANTLINTKGSRHAGKAKTDNEW